MGVQPDRPSLLALAKRYIKHKYHKPHNVYLGVVSRLDAPVTGIVLLARTSKAARRLSEQFRSRSVQKRYWALVERSLEPPAGQLVHWLRKHERHRKVLVVNAGTDGAQQARLSYRTMRRLRQAVLLEIELETGRKHQIRVQLARRQRPVLGDRKYGSSVTFGPGIALHARQLVFEHPVSRASVSLQAPLPSSWNRYTG
jgi:23S rRNA pseudouridine1911/1915/1917 synthase